MNNNKDKKYYAAYKGKELPETRSLTHQGVITRLAILDSTLARLSISELAERGYTLKKDK
jgi:hypothetical protein